MQGKNDRGGEYATHNAIAGHRFESLESPCVDLTPLHTRKPIVPLHEVTHRVRSGVCGDLYTDRYSLPWRSFGVHVTVMVADGLLGANAEVACLAYCRARCASVIVRSRRPGTVAVMLVGTPWQGRQRNHAALFEAAKGVQ